MKSFLKMLLTIALVSGCSTIGTKGVVEISPNFYMIAEMGGMDYTAATIKVRLFEQARDYCLNKNQVMALISDTGTDYSRSTYASAEIKFRCDPK